MLRGFALGNYSFCMSLVYFLYGLVRLYVLSVLSATYAQWPYKLTIHLIFYTIIFKNTPNYLQ